MSPYCLSILLLLTTLSQFTKGLPISSNHRAVYSPYWPQMATLHPRPDCEPDLCSPQLPEQSGDNYRSYRTPHIKTKRNKNTYKTGWTMGGMPFSVLYMNPKPNISLRSSVAEPFHSLQPYDDSEQLIRETFPLAEARLEEYIPEIHAPPQPSEVKGDRPTVLPTRRQYSIIPQLFVSYGWGSLRN